MDKINFDWLFESPKYTTFRVNKLKTFNIEVMKSYLRLRSEELSLAVPASLYLLSPDCLVIEPLDAEVPTCTESEIVVDALCGAAVLRGSHVFAPGVLGLPTSLKKGDKISIYADLDGKCKRGLKVPYGGRKLYVGTGYLKMSRHELFDNGIQPSGVAVETLIPTSKLPVVNESIYPKGVVVLQNLPSIICGWVMDAKPYEIILDMCAAPGNKTTHLAEMSDNKAHIIAIDKTATKVDRIKDNCNIHGITCVKAYPYDSTKSCSSDSDDLENGPPFPPNSFNKILLDAPCSGLGQRPQLVTKMTPKMQESYKFVQRKLFSTAVELLKVNGTLIYSTCTVTVDENEGLVAWALNKFPCLELIPAEPLLGGPGLSNSGLSDEHRILVQRFGPEDDTLRYVKPIYKDTIGFFIAKFTKKTNYCPTL